MAKTGRGARLGDDQPGSECDGAEVSFVSIAEIQLTDQAVTNQSFKTFGLSCAACITHAPPRETMLHYSAPMTNTPDLKTSATVATLDDPAKLASYSLVDTLNCDPDAKANGVDHAPRQVFTGHFVPAVSYTHLRPHETVLDL